MIDSQELLRWSKSLCEGADCEADYRASASRAYYALFHAILENIEVDESASPDDMGSHEFVLGELIKADKAQPIPLLGHKYRNQLWEAKDGRKTADYKLGSKFSDVTAKNSVRIAEAVIPKIKALGTRNTS